MVPCAYLRAFEPLDALPAVERERWGRYVSSGSGVSTPEAVAVEERSAAARLINWRGLLRDEAALVRRVGNRVHVCPLQLELRTAVAALAFRETVPVEVVDAFVPADVAQRALDALSHAQRPPHIRESPWVVPLQWYALFDPSERHLVDPREGRGPRMTYLTTAAQAIARLEHVVEVVDAAIEDAEELLAVLADLLDWVEQFDAASVLELDYGGLARLVPVATLEADVTCAEIGRAVDALERGDAMAAAAHYAAARARWSLLRDKPFAS